MSSNNILSPANGEPIIVPSQDVVLGLYYMTRALENRPGEGMAFANVAEVKRAYDNRVVQLHAKAKVRITETVMAEDGSREKKTSIVDTTIGRALLAEILPDGLPFALANSS
jgi:DNA-directed RNA polymerase subunit beta'